MASKTFAVLGDPIGHSLSPVIHEAAYKVLGLDWNYEAIQVSEGGLRSFLESSTIDGFSVTMPLKVEAASLAAKTDANVILTGVSNTLVRNTDGFAAFNTDIFGMSKALEAVLKNKVEVVALIGAGATAKSAMVAVAKNKPSCLFDIYVRDETRAEDLLDLAGDLGVFTSVHPLNEFSNFQELTINTLPQGASSTLPVSKQDGYLLNVNYAGSDHELVASFDSQRVIKGQTMLVWQALQQIRLFSGLNLNEELPNEDLVVKAMFEALNN